MGHLTGQLELRRVARLLKDGDKALHRQLQAAVRKPVKSFQAGVRDEVPSAVPSGYAPVLARSVRVLLNSALIGSAAGYLLTVTAKGRKEKRDLRASNAGLLRHPVYGNRDVWVAQRIRGGYVDRPRERLGSQLANELDDAVSRFATMIENG